MAGCEEQVFEGITPGHLQKFMARGAQFGLPVGGAAADHGEVTHMGVTVRWLYEDASQTLRVQCTKAPMLLPCTMIHSQIKDAVSAVLRQDATPGTASS